ncbi:putative non-specific serine/threonine protein kinase [Helianthus annuus]|nr:putative non-specific serine/threonine protein kinase [Helianthus annuus]
MSLRECEVVCKDNCSCTVYANPNMTTSGVGCLRWFGDLINVRVYALRQDLYVRQAAFELSSKVNTLNLIMHFVLYIERVETECILEGNRHALRKKNIHVDMEDLDEQPSFSLHEIVKATDDFSVNNKIGEGGFGPVYKVT